MSEPKKKPTHPWRIFIPESLKSKNKDIPLNEPYRKKQNSKNRHY